jgi:hypothetical protein
VLDYQERLSKEPLYARVRNQSDPEQHIEAAAAWLMRAQDAGNDRGVSYGVDLGASAFLPSYPETTGYIITTFLGLHHRYGEEEYLQRAIEMGEWEASIQLSSGAVMGGMLNANPTPAVFNSGMVLLGWSALIDETPGDSFRFAGERAASWLLQMQEANGNWVRGNSQFANAASTVYNVKAAWGLARMGQSLGRPEFIHAAVRNAEYALAKQLPNGWFSECCLENPVRPLLHTIAYTMQGLVGIGQVAARNDLIEAAARTASSLARLMHPDGFIPGAIDSAFRGAANWACLTGTAQTSIVWSALDRLSPNPVFAEAADRANRYLMARHDLTNPDPAIRGGIPGSWPVSGEYGRYRILNWATKFFIDALLMREPGEACRYLA